MCVHVRVLYRKNIIIYIYELKSEREHIFAYNDLFLYEIHGSYVRAYTTQILTHPVSLTSTLHLLL